MTPMTFCASFEPWEKAIAHADTSCILRDDSITAWYRIRRATQMIPIISARATTNPITGESTRGNRTLSTNLRHLNAPHPACTTTAPASAPINACEELDGIPYHHVIRFQMLAPINTAKTIVCVTSVGSVNPLAMVLATAVPVSAPTKLKTAATSTAVRSGKTPVETDVAMALAASWKPLI